MAPRYDPRLKRAIRSLDVGGRSIAEICRRAGDAAERLGVIRPSYSHVRRLVLAERERRALVRALVDTREHLVSARLAVSSPVRQRLLRARALASRRAVVVRSPDVVARCCEVEVFVRAGPTT